MPPLVGHGLAELPRASNPEVVSGESRRLRSHRPRFRSSRSTEASDFSLLTKLHGLGDVVLELVRPAIGSVMGKYAPPYGLRKTSSTRLRNAQKECEHVFRARCDQNLAVGLEEGSEAWAWIRNDGRPRSCCSENACGGDEGRSVRFSRDVQRKAARSINLRGVIRGDMGKTLDISRPIDVAGVVSTSNSEP